MSRDVNSMRSDLESSRNHLHQRDTPFSVATMRVSSALLKRSVWKGPNIVPLPIVRATGKDDKPPPIKSVLQEAYATSDASHANRN